MNLLPNLGFLGLLVDLPDFSCAVIAFIKMLHGIHANSMRTMTRRCITFCNSVPEFLVSHLLGLDGSLAFAAGSSKVGGERLNVFISNPLALMVLGPAIAGKHLLAMLGE